MVNATECSEFFLAPEQHEITSEVIKDLWERALELRPAAEARLKAKFSTVDSSRDKSDLQGGLEYYYFYHAALVEKLGLDPEDFRGFAAPSCTIFFEHPVPTESYIRLNPGYYFVFTACTELLLNCQQKGASYIYLYYEDGLMVVIDDIEYREEDLCTLLDRLNHRVVRTTKRGRGGAGISDTRMRFNPEDGIVSRGKGLSYVSDGKRIAAVLQWNPGEVRAYQTGEEPGVHYAFSMPCLPFPFFDEIQTRILEDRDVFREFRTKH